jgi:hypothetical protein
MFENVGTMLRAKKIETLKEVEVAMAKREKELLEIERIEKNIDKHKSVYRRKVEKSIERLNKVRKFMGKFGEKLTTENIIITKIEPDTKKYDDFSKSVLGNDNGNAKESSR